MEISLSPESERLVRRRIESGQYSSPEEVLRQALRLLEPHERLRYFQRDDLKTAVAQGIEQMDSGAVVHLDDSGLSEFLSSIQAEARERRAACGVGS